MTAWQQIKDRLIKFETLHGLYLVPFGIWGVYALLYSIQDTWKILCWMIFLCAIIEGCRLFGYNPIEKAAKIAVKRLKYIHLFEDKDVPPQ